MTTIKNHTGANGETTVTIMTKEPFFDMRVTRDATGELRVSMSPVVECGPVAVTAVRPRKYNIALVKAAARSDTPSQFLNNTGYVASGLNNTDYVASVKYAREISGLGLGGAKAWMDGHIGNLLMDGNASGPTVPVNFCEDRSLEVEKEFAKRGTIVTRVEVTE